MTKRGVLAIIVMVLLLSASVDAGEVKGIVFNDENKNGKLDDGEKGIKGVCVSNQREVVKTDSAGKYTLPLEKEMVIFITKPAGYMTPVNENNQPQFYFVYHPDGSPKMEFKGIDPTGEPPASLNFPLYKSKENDEFEVIISGDPQAMNHDCINYFANDTVQEICGTKAKFFLTLGDLASDNLEVHDPYIKVTGKIGVPVYNTPGNHDMNHDVPNRKNAFDTYKSKFGPEYYSFEYGKVHFIILADIEWYGKTEKDKGHYDGGVDPEQLTWLKNDIENTDKDMLLVLGMHIPFKTRFSDYNGEKVLNAKEIFQVLEKRDKVLLLGGHTHYNEHMFFDKKDGWNGKEPLRQLSCGAACGSWYGGVRDEYNLPTTTQMDGAPNGYLIFNFKGNDYDYIYKSSRMPLDFQMHISEPSGKIKAEDLSKTKIITNVFFGNERSKVECSIDSGEFKEMKNEIMKDPMFVKQRERDKDKNYDWVSPMDTDHIWTAPLPENLEKGYHKITVNTTDEFGRKFTKTAIFEVE